MPSTFKNPLQEIGQLIFERNFKKAMSIIDELLEKPKTVKTKLLEIMLVKSHIYSELEQFDEGLQLAEEVLAESEKLDNKLLIVDAFIAKLANLGVKEWWIGTGMAGSSYLYYKSSENVTQYSNLIKKGEKILQSITEISKNDSKKREIQFLRMKGIIHRKKEEFNLANQCFEKSKNHFESIKNTNEMLRDLLRILINPITSSTFDYFTKIKMDAIKLNKIVKSDFYQIIINLISLRKSLVVLFLLFTILKYYIKGW